jgi:hypothetical protein
MTDDLVKLAEAWVDAKSSVSFAAGSRSANPSLDPDGRIVEMAIDELREARTAFLTAAAQAERETAELRETLQKTADQLRTTLGDICSENSFGWEAVERAEEVLRRKS